MSQRRSRRRALTGGLVLALWLAGLGLLVRREYFRLHLERLAEAAMRLAPGAVFYGVMQGERQIGFASSTVDTAQATISFDDYLVADLPMGGRVHRANVRTHVVLSRALRVKAFAFTFEADSAPLEVRGRVLDDTLVLLTVASGKTRTPADTQRIRVTGPILVPTLVPVAIALGETPKVGKRYELPVFDPVALAPKTVGFTVKAESLFVVDDSSVFDPAAGRWRGVLPDTLKAWQVASDAAGMFNGWIDEQGRVVTTSQLGLELRRLPYEVAFENWRIDVARRAGTGGVARVSEGTDILESTAIAANRTVKPTVAKLTLRLQVAGGGLQGFDIDSPRQRLHGDTLELWRDDDAALAARYTLPMGGRRLMPAETQAEPLIQSTHPAIASLARRLAGSDADPRVVAERLNRWVHDSLTKRITFGIPSALQVLEARSGDCNEHTQLYVALARAAGIPTRITAGLAYIDGKFYYHAWPEVYLGRWVAVDPTFGQFPADAAHLRFVVGGLGRQAELLRLMGNLKIDVLAAR